MEVRSRTHKWTTFFWTFSFHIRNNYCCQHSIILQQIFSFCFIRLHFWNNGFSFLRIEFFQFRKFRVSLSKYCSQLGATATSHLWYLISARVLASCPPTKTHFFTIWTHSLAKYRHLKFDSSPWKTLFNFEQGSLVFKFGPSKVWISAQEYRIWSKTGKFNCWPQLLSHSVL